MGKTLRRIPKKRVGRIIGDSDPEYGKRNVKKTQMRNSSFLRCLEVKKARKITQEINAA